MFVWGSTDAVLAAWVGIYSSDSHVSVFLVFSMTSVLAVAMRPGLFPVIANRATCASKQCGTAALKLEVTRVLNRSQTRVNSSK